MIKICIAICFFISSAFSMQTLAPTFSLYANGDVQDMVYEAPYLYAATSNGTVDIFDVTTQEKIQTLRIPPIKDFMGEEVPAKLYSIDVLKGKLMLVSQGEKGYRNLWFYNNKQLTKKIDITQHYYIQKARFIDESHALIALLSNELIVYDLDKNSVQQLRQVSASYFADFALSEDKKSLVTTDESGVIRLLETSNLKEKQKLAVKNLDKIFQLAFKNKTVLTAGQDRKSVVYTPNETYELDFEFLLYSCGLNSDASLGAIAYNENNDVLVFDVKSQDKLYNLTENKATLTQILFTQHKELFASSESKKINFWRLP